MQIFAQPSLLAASVGGELLNTPFKPTYTYLIHVYMQTLRAQRFGYGLALVWVMFFVSILVTRITFYTSRFWVYYETDVDSAKKKRFKFKKEVA